MNRNIIRFFIVLALAVLSAGPQFAQTIDLQLDPEQNQYVTGEEILIQVQLNGFQDNTSAYLHSWVDLKGYRKLKLGNNTDNYYAPAIDVIGDGNTQLEITMRVKDDKTRWNKMLIRPNAIANSIKLSDYVTTEPTPGEWFTFSIPLADFDGLVDFTRVFNLEFPYSGGSNHYDWDISDIVFTGSQQPVIWMGNGTLNNAHNGTGGPGEVFAEWIIQEAQDQPDPEVLLLLNGEAIGSSTGYNAQFSWIPAESSSNALEVQVLVDHVLVASQTRQIEVVDQIVTDPVIEFSTNYDLTTVPAGKVFQISGSAGDIPADVSSTVTLIIDDASIENQAGPDFEFNTAIEEAGQHSWSVQVVSSNGGQALSGPFQMNVVQPDSDGRLVLNTPGDQEIMIIGQTIDISATYTASNIGGNPYLEVSNPDEGYRKLKLGNNPDNLYRPQMDLIGTGNTTLEITMKILNGNPNLRKIIVGPQEIMTNAPSLYTYWSQAEQLEDGWVRLNIPLDDFDPSIDFRSIGYLVFPYSQNAGDFTFGIREISFTGGDKIVYFGEDQINNIHDGFGLPGQLLASLVNHESASEPDHYLLFVNNTLFTETDELGTSLAFTPESAGEYRVEVIGIFPDGQMITSGSATEQVIENPTSEGSIQLRLILNQDETLNVSKAALRYNKAFAYSLTLDDGYADAYDHAFKILNGGIIPDYGGPYPGLFFTDGCGNDVPFTAGTAWYSVSRSYIDIHTQTPGYITWTELTEMFNAGWDVLNHSYSHTTADDTDFYWEIDQNQQAVLANTGIEMSQFVIPGGGDYTLYLDEAYRYGMHGIYAYKSSLEGYPAGLQIDGPRDWSGIGVFRAYNYDSKSDESNIMNAIDNVAAGSSENNHIWYNDFTHRIHLSNISGSLRLETFEYYMNQIESQYGKSGNDAIWMASLQQVWEYLFVRDHTQIMTEKNAGEYLISIDVSQIPDVLRTKAISLLAPSNSGYTVESLTPGVEVAYNAQTGLINLEWDKKQAHLKTQKLVSPDSPDQFEYVIYPNPVEDKLFIRLRNCPGESIIRIYNLNGQTVYQKSLHSDDQVWNLVIGREEIQATAGLLLLTIHSGDQVIQEKIIIK